MSIPYLIREAVPGDAEDMAQLEQELFPESWLSACSLITEMQYGPSFVALNGDQIIAYAVTSYRDGVLDLLRLGVTAESQGTGVGRRLLDAVLSVPCDMRILTVRKDNLRAIHLYKSSGFALHGELGNSVVLVSI